MGNRSVLITAPTVEPVTVAEAIAHLRLDVSAGEPAPVALTATLGSGAGNLTAGDYRYRLTFVTADGETEGGTISDSVTVADAGVNGKIALTVIPTGGANVTSRNLYRTEADGTDYKKLAALADNTTVIYADNIADASLGTGAPTTNTTLDDTISDLVTVARSIAEKRMGRAIITQTWDYYLDSFNSQAIKIPMPPLQEISYIKYYNQAGTLTTIDSDDYTVVTQNIPGFVVPAYGESWPVSRGHTNDIVIRFVAGEGDAGSDVDSTIRQAIKIIISHLYDNRELVAAVNLNKIPMSAEMFLDNIPGPGWFYE